MKRPVVLENATLSSILESTINNRPSLSTIIICSTRETFLEQLLTSLTAQRDSAEAETDQPEPSEKMHQTISRHSTLRLLLVSRLVDLVFCPSVSHLRAYLAARAVDGTSRSGSITQNVEKGTLTIINSIALHRSTSAFSAQGFNRIFAAAVEASIRLRQQLVLAECLDLVIDTDVEQAEVYDDDTGQTRTTAALSDPWDEEVSILNVTTKTFGAGERGWAGRTVKIRHIAERWFTFERSTDNAALR